jgi:hypothetical protein
VFLLPRDLEIRLAVNALPKELRDGAAPFLTDADIGGVPGKTAFVDRPGPHGMIIVLAGEKEREALMSESQSLVDEVERQIGLR